MQVAVYDGVRSKLARPPSGLKSCLLSDSYREVCSSRRAVQPFSPSARSINEITMKQSKPRLAGFRQDPAGRFCMHASLRGFL